MFIYLVLVLPAGSSDLPETDGPPYVSFWSCFGWGLHMPRKLPCGRWSLKPPFHPYQQKLAVYFCCTSLGVASTGRYPASCPVKPGLSSPCRESKTPASREHLSYSYLFCNCSEPSKISQNRRKMLAFLRLFLKFYLADTPHRRNAKHFGGWL